MDTYIVKPSAGAMGRGIFMAQTEKDVDLSELTTSVAQLYISEPLLLSGLKFDLRLYVLITSVDPLQVWLWMHVHHSTVLDQFNSEVQVALLILECRITISFWIVATGFWVLVFV